MKYKGYEYYKDTDGLWKIKLDKENVFVVALDDSKFNGRRTINWEKNDEKTSKKFIEQMRT